MNLLECVLYNINNIGVLRLSQHQKICFIRQIFANTTTKIQQYPIHKNVLYYFIFSDFWKAKDSAISCRSAEYFSQLKSLNDMIRTNFKVRVLMNKSEDKVINAAVQLLTIEPDEELQRIDNYLLTKLKGVPKSLIYRIIRKGEVRVNKGRIKPEYKLQVGDVVRIPPVRISEKSNTAPISTKLNKVNALEQQILFEDDQLLIINKPSGIAVHGGSGLSFGVIEALRALRPQAKFLELVHRLDRDTSGILLVAKKRSALRNLHQQLREKTIQKDYLALVRGEWQSHCKVVKAPLLKNELSSGERIVKVSDQGKPSETRFKVEERFKIATLVKASPVTGRTHQIRVHTQYAGHPIAFDSKYGSKEFDQQLAPLGLQRLFLHAASIRFTHPKSGEQMVITAPLDQQCKQLLAKLRN